MNRFFTFIGLFLKLRIFNFEPLSRVTKVKLIINPHSSSLRHTLGIIYAGFGAFPLFFGKFLVLTLISF